MRCKSVFFSVMVGCFVLSLAMHYAIFVTSAKANEGQKTPQVLTYVRDDGDSFTRAGVVWYTDTIFNLDVWGGANEGAWSCAYASVCKRDGLNFLCQGEMVEDPLAKKMVPDNVTGTITAEKVKITYAVPWQHCGMRGLLEGDYLARAQDASKKYTIHKAQVLPVALEEGDTVSYYVKTKDDAGLSLVYTNNVTSLDTFKNTWVDIEYLTFSEYHEPAGENINFHILYKVNGKNPMEIKGP